MRLDHLSLVLVVGEALLSAGTSSNLPDRDLEKQPTMIMKRVLMIIKYVLLDADRNT